MNECAADRTHVTVGQLIANLSAYPADAKVLVHCGPGRPFQSPGTTENPFLRG